MRRCVILALAWGVVVVSGYGALLRYQARAAPVDRAVAPHWPKELPLARGPRSTLLLVLHPQCACSRATVRELERLLARAPSSLRTYVLMVRPAGAPVGFERGALWDMVADIPGVTPVVDVGGRMAEKLGPTTSGHALLYDDDGALQFSGGLTQARGHEGESAGGRTLAALLAGTRQEPATTSVFGCALHHATQPAQPGGRL